MERRQTLELTCEYLKAPLGVQNPAPRFGWRVSGEDLCTIQKEYRIRVYDMHHDCVWDSGPVQSDRCSAIEYEGAPLHSFEAYRFEAEVRLAEVWNGKDAAWLWGETSFEMGILDRSEWQGEWICAGRDLGSAVPLFRREFTLERIPERARVYISGIGYCEAWLNGKRLGDAVLDPGWTDYRKRVLYRVYDVTDLLTEGKNVFSAELGGGWLTLDHEAFDHMIGRKPSWLSEPKLLCNICLDEQCIATAGDGTWMYSEGPVRRHNLYDGEWYDASWEKEGYRLPSYRCKPEEWSPAAAAEAPGGVLCSQLMPPIRQVLERDPVYLEYIGEESEFSTVVDFGVNASGWVRLSAVGKPGQRIRLRYGETLRADHSVDQRNLRWAKAEDVIVFGERDRITYQPHFIYHGFRYVQIFQDPGVIIDDLKGCEVHTDAASAGHFTCSDAVLNNIQKAVVQTELNNLHSVPTDCPQRDERLGWMNDMTVRFEEGLYNFDLILFYEKWLADIADAQDENGAVPDTVPYFYGELPAVHISSVYLLLPWHLYLFYGDRQVLKRHYAGMRRYLRFKLGEREENGLLPGRYMGDWAPAMTEAYIGEGINAIPRNLTHSFLTTCYLYYDCRLMEKVGNVLGMEADAAEYRREADGIREVLNRQFLREEGYYDTGSQGCNVFPLFLDIVPEQQKDRVLWHLLEELVTKRGCRVTTGNQMTKYLYEVLNRENLNETAYRVAAGEDYPSIGFMLKNGATTIWERWENLTSRQMNSHNHPMLGAFTVWFYKGLAGITLDETQERRLILRPAVIPQLTYVEASHEFCWGKCAVKWERTGQEIVYSFTVPWGMSAVLDLSHVSISIWALLCDEKEMECEEAEKRIFTGGSYRIRMITQLTEVFDKLFHRV